MGWLLRNDIQSPTLPIRIWFARSMARSLTGISSRPIGRRQHVVENEPGRDQNHQERDDGDDGKDAGENCDVHRLTVSEGIGVC